MVPIKRMNYRDAPDNRIVFEHEPAGFWLLRWRFGFLIRFVVFFVTVRRFSRYSMPALGAGLRERRKYSLCLWRKTIFRAFTGWGSLSLWTIRAT
jgi:hypothetical protein